MFRSSEVRKITLSPPKPSTGFTIAPCAAPRMNRSSRSTSPSITVSGISSGKRSGNSFSFALRIPLGRFTTQGRGLPERSQSWVAWRYSASTGGSLRRKSTSSSEIGATWSESTENARAGSFSTFTDFIRATVRPPA